MDIETEPKNPAKTQYFNREISWLDFNDRVLAESHDPETPILEKLKFIGIAYNNLDEFFMVRVAGKKKAAHERLSTSDSPDNGYYPEILGGIEAKAKEQHHQIYNSYGRVLKELATENTLIVSYDELSESEKDRLKDYFHSHIFPILTPLAVDPAHPFPFLSNLGLYLVVEFRTVGYSNNDTPPIAFVEVPHILPRYFQVTTDRLILIEDVIAKHIENLFWGFEIKRIHHVRVTRDLDIALLENDVVDLLQSVQNQVKAREQANPVRLEVSPGVPNHLLDFLLRTLGLTDADVYVAGGPLSLACLFELYKLPLERLKFEAFNPRIPSAFRKNANIFSIIRDEDILLHHPFESFYTVIEFLRMAARDPKVLAINKHCTAPRATHRLSMP